MNIDFNPYGEYETPDLILCNPNRKQLCTIGGAKDTTLTLTFNGLSELSFSINSKFKHYDLVQKNRLIYILDIGYFIITSENEQSDGFTTYKEINCKSFEYTLNKQLANIADGTYVFWNPVSPSTTLLGQILKSTPYSNWKIGYVSGSLWNKYRTFEISDTPLYSFIMTDVATAYEAIFKFDTINNLINVYDSTEAITKTNIMFTYDNLIKSMSKQSTEDEIITALSVVGDDTLDIHNVNIMGNNLIYNFDYVMNPDWMSPELISGLTNWKNTVDYYRVSYANHIDMYYNNKILLVTLNSQLTDLNNELNRLKMIQTERIVQGVIDLSDIYNQIVQTEFNIKVKQDEIKHYTQHEWNIVNQLGIYTNLVQFDKFLNPSLLSELDNFIYTGTYQNENFGVLESTTVEVRRSLTEDLYNQGVNALSKLSKPTYTLDINSVAYLFNENKYEYFRQFTNVGSVVTVELPNGDIFQPVILQMTIPYDDPTQFQLKFSNKLRLNSSEWTFGELQGDTSKSNNKVAISGLKWNQTSNNMDEVSNYINGALNLTTKDIINSDKQTTIIDQHGIQNRRMNDDGSYSGEEMRITNNVIAFSKDNFRTSSLAMGRIPSPYANGSYLYGLIADAVIGRLVAGNQLLITNENNYFRVDGSGATLYNANLTVLRNDNRAKILLDANNGIMIQTNEGYGFRNSFYVDYAGNIIANDIVTTSGTIGGWNIRSDGLYSPYGDYLKADGTFKISLMTGTPTYARFDGDIFAKNLDFRGITTDKIGYNQVDNGVLGNNSVSTGKIQDRAVTENKLDELWVNRLYANYAKIGQLEAETANINNLMVQNFNATNATIGTLNARVLNVETLKIDALQAKKIVADEINARNLVVQNSTFNGNMNLPNGGYIRGEGWGINIGSSQQSVRITASLRVEGGLTVTSNINTSGTVACTALNVSGSSFSVNGINYRDTTIKDANGNIYRVLANKTS